jgi:cell fate (sporulation/competence/biofilm development) regulator YlbF (YheA/YmcA/DUF963 family)
MFSESELQHLDDQVEAFMENSQELHNTFQEFLTQHQLLIKNYRRLQNDYVGERMTSERYKELTKEQVS